MINGVLGGDETGFWGDETGFLGGTKRGFGGRNGFFGGTKRGFGGDGVREAGASPAATILIFFRCYFAFVLMLMYSTS